MLYPNESLGAYTVTELEYTLNRIQEELEERRKVIIELTREQAQFIFDVLQHVGGDPKTSRRRHAQEVLHTLGEEGITYQPHEDIKESIWVYTPEEDPDV